MAEETTTTQGETPETTAATTTTGAAETSGQGSWDGDFNPERARATIDKLRGHEKEAKRLAKELADAQAALKAREEAELSETDKLKRRLSEYEQQTAAWERERADLARAHQEDVVRLNVMLAASKPAVDKDGVVKRAAIVDPDAAFRLLDLAALEFGDDGRPTNLEALLARLLTDRPYLAAPTTNGETPAVRPAGAIPATPRQQGTVGKLSEDETRKRAVGIRNIW